jgi:hypothetical protein
MRGSMLKLFAAGVLMTSSYTQPLKADQPTCQDSAEYCAGTYAGCPFVMGFPPGVQMFCLTGCEEPNDVMYAEHCDL